MIQTRTPLEQIPRSGFYCACADHTGHMTSVFIHAAFMNPTDISAPCCKRCLELLIFHRDSVLSYLLVVLKPD